MRNKYGIALIFAETILVISLFQGVYWWILWSVILFLVIFAIIMKRTRKTKIEYTEEFESIYQKMKNLFGKEYKKNKKRLRTFIITLFALLVSFICFLFVLPTFDKMSDESKIGIMCGISSLFFVTECICLNKIIDLELSNAKIYDAFLLPIFISDIDNNLKYKKNLLAAKWKIERRYINSGIEEKKYNVFKCEDFVTRRIRWCNTF